MKKNIIVVDDFYSDSMQVRNAALNAGYPEPESTYTYPGKNSEKNFYSEEIHSRIESIIGKKLTPAPNNGYFRLSLEKDSCQQDIHIDPSWDWGGVLYMSDPKDCVDEAGTSFWRHNELQIEEIPRGDSSSKEYGWSNYKESWFSTVYGDGLDRSKWTRYFLCPMKFNRLVLFRTHLWHSHNYNFGDTLENGRIVQLFFFDPCEDWKNI